MVKNMYFVNGFISTILIALLAIISVFSEANENSDLIPRIIKQRTAGCPLRLDTKELTGDDLNSYLKDQVFAEFPHERMRKYITPKSDIKPNQVLMSNGGYFKIKNNRNSVSQLYCDYKDVDGKTFYVVFRFRADLTFHVKGFLPTMPEEKLFAKSGELPCAALDELNTREKPHCQITLANILVTNLVETTRVSGYSKNPEFYGSLSYKSVFDIGTYKGETGAVMLIKPENTEVYPVSQTYAHAVSIEVKLYKQMQDVTELCIDSWLPAVNMLVKYGASPHIIISGKVGFDGNPKETFKCELHCNNKEDKKDCWDVQLSEKIFYYFSRVKRHNLQRNYLLSEVRKAYPDYLDTSSDSDDVLIEKYQEILFSRDLGLEPGASINDVKKAFRVLSKELDPDKSKNNQDRYNVAKKAHEKLLKIKGSRKPAHDEL